MDGRNSYGNKNEIQRVMSFVIFSQNDTQHLVGEKGTFTMSMV